jgi:hypothetical protein
VIAAVRIAALALAAAMLASCGGSKRSADSPILTGSPQKVSFAEVKSAVGSVYRSSPGVTSFAVRNVTYTPASRDVVLNVCRHGGAASNAQELETSRLEACAPLIFFFYRYGRQASVANSTELARKLYWYAATNVDGPFNAGPSLKALLSSWGVK